MVKAIRFTIVGLGTVGFRANSGTLEEKDILMGAATAT